MQRTVEVASVIYTYERHTQVCAPGKQLHLNLRTKQEITSLSQGHGDRTEQIVKEVMILHRYSYNSKLEGKKLILRME